MLVDAYDAAATGDFSKVSIIARFDLPTLVFLSHAHLSKALLFYPSVSCFYELLTQSP
jgi:hypothetical protein